MALDRKIVTLLPCLTVVIIVGVWYACTRVEPPQSFEIIDDADAEPGTFASISLKSVTVIFRHGDRSPAFNYKTFPDIYKNNFPEGKGQLTKIGKQHMYEKGKLLRRLYNGFLSDLYLDGEIVIKTTNLSRTFMTASMVLAGMYPPKYYQKWSDDLETVWQPILISTDSPDQSELFRNVKCPYINFFMKKDDESIINNKNKNQIKKLLSHLSEKCGTPINITTMFNLYDLFESMISNELLLPEWINHEQFQLMESIFNEQTRRIFDNKKIQNIITGPLLKQISLNMVLQSNNSNYIKTKNVMHLYSGHDLTLGTMMYFLGNNNIKMPDFGASIHFHLYLNKTLKVFYYNKWDDENGEEMSIPKCGHSCKLDDFVNLINNDVSTEWKKDCQIVGN